MRAQVLKWFEMFFLRYNQNDNNIKTFLFREVNESKEIHKINNNEWNEENFYLWIYNT